MSKYSDTVVVICSRIQSSRIKQKPFLKIAGVPAIEHILRRLGTSYPIILAVPPGESQAYTEKIKSKTNLSFFEGFPDSPLHRMKAALKENAPYAKYVVRITHDDIFIDKKSMDDLIHECHDKKAGYGVSDGIFEGAGTEVISVQNLNYAADSTKENVEHISYFVRGKNMPDPVLLKVPTRMEIRRKYRMTLDYQNDYIVIQTVLRSLGPDASNDLICDFLDKHRWISNINKTPILTIYTCVYNTEKYIVESLSLPVFQSDDTERIVLDDGSTDCTLFRILQNNQFKHRKSPSLFISDENKGLASSCNRVLEEAKGKYIMRIDADDVLCGTGEQKIRKMIEIAESDLSAVVYPNHHVTDEKLKIIHENVSGCQSHHVGGALMNRSIINELKFTEGLRHWDSIDLYKRIKNRFPISYFTEPLFFYRKHAKNISRDTPERAEAFATIKSIYGNSDTTTSVIPYR